MLSQVEVYSSKSYEWHPPHLVIDNAGTNEAGESMTNPRNPRHFNMMEGGRQRVSTIFMDKGIVSCA